MALDDTVTVTSITETDAAARSTAGRLLQKPKRNRRPPEDTRIRVTVDARTKPGRAVRMLRLRLLSHLGPKPSQTALVLVEQLLQLKLRLSIMDANFVEAGGKLSAHDTHTYLAWSNSLVRGLKQLGLDGFSAEAAPSLADALAAGCAQVAGDAPASTRRVDRPAPADARLSGAQGPP
jgi:hypothetical protein